MTITPGLQLGREFAFFSDDTEESIVGSSQHQGAITVLFDSLEAYQVAQELPWFIGSQLRMTVPRLGQHPLTLMPDLLIHPTLGPAHRDGIAVALEGPPTLVIEVASPSTAKERDLAEGVPQGKPALYAALGIPEYLVYDPTQRYLPMGLWARKLSPQGHYQPWEPAADGRWHSALGIAFQPQSDGPLLRVYGHDGVLLPTNVERMLQQRQAEAQLAALIDDNAHLQSALNERDAAIAALRAELRRLRGE